MNSVTICEPYIYIWVAAFILLLFFAILFLVKYIKTKRDLKDISAYYTDLHGCMNTVSDSLPKAVKGTNFKNQCWMQLMDEGKKYIVIDNKSKTISLTIFDMIKDKEEKVAKEK